MRTKLTTIILATAFSASALATSTAEPCISSCETWGSKCLQQNQDELDRPGSGAEQWVKNMSDDWCRKTVDTCKRIMEREKVGLKPGSFKSVRVAE